MPRRKDPTETPILHYAVRLLAARPYSEKKLREKLRTRGYVPSEIDEALERLREKDFVNDRRFAQDFIRARLVTHPRGKMALVRDLVSRGVPAKLADEVVQEQVDNASEEQLARELFERKSAQYSELDPEVRKRRLACLLARRGFRPQTIYRLLDAADDVNS